MLFGLFVDHGEQAHLVAELVIQRPTGDPGLGDDRLGGYIVEAFVGEQLSAGIDQQRAGSGRPLGLGAPGGRRRRGLIVDFHTVCT